MCLADTTMEAEVVEEARLLVGTFVPQFEASFWTSPSSLKDEFRLEHLIWIFLEVFCDANKKNYLMY